MLHIKDVLKANRLFNFLSNLRPWAQLKLRWQGVKDLSVALATVDGLVDLRINKSNNGSSTNKARFLEKNQKERTNRKILVRRPKMSIKEKPRWKAHDIRSIKVTLIQVISFVMNLTWLGIIQIETNSMLLWQRIVGMVIQIQKGHKELHLHNYCNSCKDGQNLPQTNVHTNEDQQTSDINYDGYGCHP